jgi:hypothetical protein
MYIYIYCLKLRFIWNQRSSSISSIYGVSIPTRYAAWIECVMISVLNSNISFIGHLSGIIAGALYPYISKSTSIFTSWMKSLYASQPTRYTYSSGRVGEIKSTNPQNKVNVRYARESRGGF